MRPLLLAVVTLTACGGGRAADRPARPVPTSGRSVVVTAQDIKDSGAQTAWDALRRNVRVISFQGTTRGASRGGMRVTRRGSSTVYLDDQTRVYVDRVRLTDITALELMPASDIERIEVLTGLDATTYFGTNAGSGVILIFTRVGIEPEGEQVPPPKAVERQLARNG